MRTLLCLGVLITFAFTKPSLANDGQSKRIQLSATTQDLLDASSYKLALPAIRQELDRCQAHASATIERCMDLTLALIDTGLYVKDHALVEREAMAIISRTQTGAGKTSPDRSIALNAMGIVRQQQGRFAEARAFYDEDLALTRAVRGAQDDGAAESLLNIGVLLDFYMGRWSEAEPYLKEATGIWSKNHGPESLEAAVGYNALARNLDNQGRFVQAETTYRRVLAIQRRLLPADHSQTAKTLNNMSVVLNELGEADAAEDAARQAVAIQTRRLGFGDVEANTAYLTLARALAAQGKTREAEEVYQSLRPAIEAKGATLQHSFLNLQNARLYGQQKNFAAALPLYERALANETSRKGSNVQVRTVIAAELADVYLKLGKLDRAEQINTETLAIFSSIIAPKDSQWGDALIVAGDIARGHRNPDAAALHYRKAIAQYALTLPADHRSVVTATARLATALSEAGPEYRAETTATFARAADLAKSRLRRERLAGLDRSGTRDDFRTIFLDQLADLADAGTTPPEQLENAFIAAQLARQSAAARAAGRNAAARARSAEAAALDLQLRQIAQEIDALDSVRARIDPATESEALTQNAEAVARARSLYSQLLAKADIAPSSATDPDHTIATLASVQSQLAEGEAAIFALADEQRGYYRFTITRQNARWSFTPDPGLQRMNGLSLAVRTSLFDSASTTRGQRSTMPDGGAEGGPKPAFAAGAAAEIGRWFCADLPASGIKRLFRVADGPLARLPLAVLRDDRGWLVDRFIVSDRTSLARRSGASEKAIAKRDIAAVGVAETRGGANLGQEASAPAKAKLAGLPALPFARLEMDALGQLPFARVTLRYDSDATERWFKSDPAVIAADLLLIASHNVAPDLEDARSEAGLALTGEADGMLRQSEVAALSLAARLVILSACDTSQPAPANDDPASGFARSFFAAGARAVMVSSWPIADNTQAVLMARYLKAWSNDGAAADPAALLQKAMLAVRARGGLLSHPRNWAAMTIIEP